MANLNDSRILKKWRFSTDFSNERPVIWYIIGIIIAAGLFLYAIFTSNFLFAAIILLVVFIYFFSSIYRPLPIECCITEEGIYLNKRCYKFGEIKKFWIIYEPKENINSLYIEFKNNFVPVLNIPLITEDPVEVRQILLDYLLEDLAKDKEPFSEAITRMLKL